MPQSDQHSSIPRRLLPPAWLQRRHPELACLEDNPVFLHHVRRIDKYPIYHPKRGYIVLLFIMTMIVVYTYLRDMLPRHYRIVFINLIWPLIFLYRFFFMTKGEKMNAWIRQMFNGLERDPVRELFMSGHSPREVAMGIIATRLSRESIYWRIGTYLIADIIIGALLYINFNIPIIFVMITMAIIILMQAVFTYHIDCLAFSMRSRGLTGVIVRNFGGVASRIKSTFKIVGLILLFQIVFTFLIVLGLRISSSNAFLLGPYISVCCLFAFLVLWAYLRRLNRRREKLIRQLALYYEILMMGAAYGEGFRLRDYPEKFKRFKEMK